MYSKLYKPKLKMTTLRRTLIQTSSWDLGPPGLAHQPQKASAVSVNPTRTASCDTHDEPCWSTDPSDEDDDEPDHPPVCTARRDCTRDLYRSHDCRTDHVRL